MDTVTFKIPNEIRERLAAYARETGVSKSEVLRQALQEYLANSDHIVEDSFGALTADLAGSLDGPEDLATNPKYMEGFGR